MLDREIMMLRKNLNGTEMKQKHFFLLPHGGIEPQPGLWEIHTLMRLLACLLRSHQHWQSFSCFEKYKGQENYLMFLHTGILSFYISKLTVWIPIYRLLGFFSPEVYLS